MEKPDSQQLYKAVHDARLPAGYAFDPLGITEEQLAALVEAARDTVRTCDNRSIDNTLGGLIDDLGESLQPFQHVGEK